MHQRLQKYPEFVELSVCWIAQPGENLNTIPRLPFKIVANVVNDDCLAEVPSDFAQVLDINAVIKLAVVSIQPMRDVILALLGSGLINVIEDEVGVVLDSSCEDDDFVKLGHILQKLDTARSQFELFVLGDKMHKGFIQVENKRVTTLGLIALLQKVVRALRGSSWLKIGVGFIQVLATEIVFVLCLPQDLLCPLF